MTQPINHSQQQLTYLQAWQQLLEPLATMGALIPPPGAQWPVPPMPLLPPPPPAPGPSVPADFAQQLFGLLQSWRQYLEQAAGAPPEPVQKQGPALPGWGGYSPDARPPGRPGLPLPPENPGGGRTTTPTGNDADRSGRSQWPADRVGIRPLNPGGNQVPDDLQEKTDIYLEPEHSEQAAVRARGPQVLLPPAADSGGRINDAIRERATGAEPLTRGAFTSATSRDRAFRADPAVNRPVAASASVPLTVRPLFKGLADRTIARG